MICAPTPPCPRPPLASSKLANDPVEARGQRRPIAVDLDAFQPRARACLEAHVARGAPAEVFREQPEQRRFGLALARRRAHPRLEHFLAAREPADAVDRIAAALWGGADR